MALTNAITDLFSSFYELLASIVGTIYGLISTFVMAIVNFITSIFALVGDVFKGAFDIAGGVGRFLTGMSTLPVPSLVIPSIRRGWQKLTRCCYQLQPTPYLF